MAAILLVGIVSYTQLPVSALPEVDYPTIQVLTFYPGASPQVVATTVNSTAGATVWPTPGVEPDDFVELRRNLGGGVLQFNLSLNLGRGGRRGSVGD